MSLIMLIIGIINAIPTIINIIKEIMDLIHNLKGPEKVAAQKDLGVILKRHHKGGFKDRHGAEKELVDFKQNLMNKYT